MYDPILTMIDDVNSTSSTTAKVAILAKYKNDALVVWALKETYSTQIRHYVTGATLRKNLEKFSKFPDNIGHNRTLPEVMDLLSSRRMTGHSALILLTSWITSNRKYEDLVYRILDGNLKIRMDVRSINKAIPDCVPTFDVPLAETYTPDRQLDLREWYVSRKLDGVRCLAVFDEQGQCKLKSREGNDFETLGSLQRMLSARGYTNLVLDGEVCITDPQGGESFSAIQRQIGKKNHDIAEAVFLVFDMVPLSIFESGEGGIPYRERLSNLKDLLTTAPTPNFNTTTRVDLLHQEIVSDVDHLATWINRAADKKWEGLIIRKDTQWAGRRSLDMLKVKTFPDAEYVVLDVEMSRMRMFFDGVEKEVDALGAAWIRHKGTMVKVGSGWSQPERLFYFANPEQLIGRVLTVQYFEETTNITGGHSLRFPVVKAIHGVERTT
jgi:DNA ligase-1